MTKLKTNDVFYSKVSAKQLFNEGFEIREKLRKQMPPTTKEDADKLVEVEEKTSKKQWIDTETYEEQII